MTVLADPQNQRLRLLGSRVSFVCPQISLSSHDHDRRIASRTLHMSCATYCRCVSYPTPTGNGATGATPSWPAARVGWIWLAAALPRRAHWAAATRSRTPPSLGLLSIRLARGGSSRSGKVTSTTKPAAGHAREKPSARLSLVFFLLLLLLGFVLLPLAPHARARGGRLREFCARQQ